MKRFFSFAWPIAVGISLGLLLSWYSNTHQPTTVLSDLIIPTDSGAIQFGLKSDHTIVWRAIELKEAQ